MSRVLIITFCFPPAEVIGSIRPGALAKYLPNLGWDVTVLAPRLGQGRSDPNVVETEYRAILATWKARLGFNAKRTVHEQLRLPVSSKPGSLFHTWMLEIAKYVITYPDETKGWIPFAIRAVEQIRDEGVKIDAIVTTSPAVSAHIIGSKAKTLLKCPWVADFRDLWSQNLSNLWSGLDAVQSGLERRTLKHADALVTVSRPWAEKLQTRYPKKPVFEITNGFDPDDFARVPKELTSSFTITYAGLLYQGRRDPKLLFHALRELCDRGLMHPQDVSVRFYGRLEPWLMALIEQYQLEACVRAHGVIPRREVLQRQAESQLLLLLGWNDPRETGQHTGKLFEYLGAERPILAVGGTPGVLTDTLIKTRAGVHATSKEQVLEFLLKAYQEYQTTGRVAYKADAGAIGKYTHSEMARRFAEVLNRVTVGHADSLEATQLQTINV
jgi:glycosyltransferase involved in cell wall biosynthesis